MSFHVAVSTNGVIIIKECKQDLQREEVAIIRPINRAKMDDGGTDAPSGGVKTC